MNVPISWLREYVDLPTDSQAVADRLALLGFPVAHVERRPRIDGVVVGKIATQKKHPNADRLQICTIDIGESNALTIVTAATNVAAGQTVPVARVGARLPQLTIARRTMRGIASEGMLCSPGELALPPEWFEDGIMILDESLPLGGDCVELLGLRDDVLDVEVTSNRVDAMSVIGLARELAAATGSALRLPSFENPGVAAAEPPPRIALESSDCVRFVLQRIEGLRVAPAPARMRVRLALCGVRPIDSIVDVSNYVMLEVGAPLHLYDARRVAGQRLIVRDARGGERLQTLDGVEHTLEPAALVIADEKHVLGLAGVMGGASSEIAPDTTAVLLEAAAFDGARVRRTAQLVSLRTQASSRHERCVPPALAEMAAARAAALFVESGARAFAPVIAGEPARSREIALSAGEVRRLLGIDLGAARIAQHLRALACGVRDDAQTLWVTPPPWRGDLTIAADLVEEVARIEGYDAIEPAMPAVAPHGISSAEYEREGTIARTMAAIGYHEVLTYSLGRDAGDAAVELRNPLSEEQRYLRTDLVPALVAHVARAGAPYRAFEIGHVFSSHEGAIDERSMLGLAVAAQAREEPPWSDAEFLAVKGDIEALVRELTGRTPLVAPAERPPLHAGKCAALFLDGGEIGVFGRIDPREERLLGGLALYAGTIRLDRLPQAETPRYRPPSRFPSTYRDLALSVAAEVSARSVEETATHAIGDICTAVRVFDEYRGPQVEQGRKSLALRATMRRFDGTITDEEAEAAVTRAVQALYERLGAIVRV
ncbi:MAG: phenylalanine--tRNA ligase subunit beta [Candidatus Tyrphobacter sp.]